MAHGTGLGNAACLEVTSCVFDRLKLPARPTMTHLSSVYVLCLTLQFFPPASRLKVVEGLTVWLFSRVCPCGVECLTGKALEQVK